MKFSPNRIFVIHATLCILFSLLFSCSKDTELLLAEETIVENTVEPDTTDETDETEDTEDPPPSDDTDTDNTEEEETPVDTENKVTSNTKVSISGNQFYINDELTYKGRFWQGNKVEGLLMNSRMVQGIFDDSNPATKQQFAYPDTNTWSADRNTNEFIAAMPIWKSKGMLAFTLNLQGGSPTGYGNTQPWVNSAFNPEGGLKPDYLKRLKRILDRADELNMVVILGYFYFGQDQVLRNEYAVLNAVDRITNWLLEQGYDNLLIEVNNECNHPTYDHAILRANRIHELVNRVKQTELNGKRLLVSTSYTGGQIPSSKVIQASDYILLHGNGVHTPNALRTFITNTKNVSQNKPIIINEDDHFDFYKNDYNFKASVEGYVSWGFFDYRKQGEGFEEGFQSVPIDWGINSSRKNNFFNKMKQITGY